MAEKETDPEIEPEDEPKVKEAIEEEEGKMEDTSGIHPRQTYYIEQYLEMNLNYIDVTKAKFNFGQVNPLTFQVKGDPDKMWSQVHKQRVTDAKHAKEVPIDRVQGYRTGWDPTRSSKDLMTTTAATNTLKSDLESIGFEVTKKSNFRQDDIMNPTLAKILANTMTYTMNAAYREFRVDAILYMLWVTKEIENIRAILDALAHMGIKANYTYTIQQFQKIVLSSESEMLKALGKKMALSKTLSADINAGAPIILEVTIAGKPLIQFVKRINHATDISSIFAHLITQVKIHRIDKVKVVNIIEPPNQKYKWRTSGKKINLTAMLNNFIDATQTKIKESAEKALVLEEVLKELTYRVFNNGTEVGRYNVTDVIMIAELVALEGFAYQVEQGGG
jgi:hypothetical protein